MQKYSYNVREFGNRIRTIRQRNKMTQGQLAEQLYLSVDSISKIENGKVMCMPEHLVKICQIFNISADYFYFGMERELVSKRPGEVEQICSMLTGCKDAELSKICRIVRILLEPQ